MLTFNDATLEGARFRTPDDDGYRHLVSYAFPGGYPLVYVDGDGSCLCPSCADEEEKQRHLTPDDDGWMLEAPIVGYFANYEDVIFCDACGAAQFGAYVEEEAREYDPSNGGAS